MYSQYKPYHQPSQYSQQYHEGDRFFFPFLTGALIGGAAVGLSRPRPIINVVPAPYVQPYGPIPYYGYPQGYGGGYSYNYYGY